MFERRATIQMVQDATAPQPFRFQCIAGCGNCCTGEGAVYFTPDDLKAIREYLKLDNARFASLRKRLIQKKKNGLLIHRSNTDCLFLEGKSVCKIYPARPLQCRSYPFWYSVYESKENFEWHTSHCPGFQAEAGTPYSALQITRRINSTLKNFNESQTNQLDRIVL